MRTLCYQEIETIIDNEIVSLTYNFIVSFVIL